MRIPMVKRNLESQSRFKNLRATTPGPFRRMPEKLLNRRRELFALIYNRTQVIKKARALYGTDVWKIRLRIADMMTPDCQTRAFGITHEKKEMYFQHKFFETIQAV